MPQKKSMHDLGQPIETVNGSDSCCGSDKGGCCESDSSCGSGSSCGMRIWAAAFIIVAVQVVTTAYFSDLSVRKTTEGFKDFEYAKMGDKTTYDLVSKAQYLQLKTQLPQIKSFVETTEKAGTPNTPESMTAPAGTDTTKPQATMSKDEIAAIQANSFFAGEPSARILAVEYTDPECPYCIRQAKDRVLPKLLEKFAGKVRYSHKPFRAVPHPGAEAKAVGMICAGKLGGATAYNGLYDGIMSASTQERVMPLDNLLALAKDLKLDLKKFTGCTDDKASVNQYDAYTAEGQKYGVSGTPGTVIVDTETGKYELIAGAYPYESFEAAVEKLLK